MYSLAPAETWASTPTPLFPFHHPFSLISSISWVFLKSALFSLTSLPYSLLPVPHYLSPVPRDHLATHTPAPNFKHLKERDRFSPFLNCVCLSLHNTAGHNTSRVCGRINGGPVKYDYTQSAVSTLWNLSHPLSSFRSDGSALVAI